MKTLYPTLFFLLIICIPAMAQKGQPAFGKVDVADMEMKDCDFDKGADAVVLIDYGNIYYDRGTAGLSVFKTVFERRTRIKILKEKGITHADIALQYYTHNNEERILWLTANTYNLNASGKVQTTEVKKNSIYSKKIDGNYSKMIVAFPDVKVGSIIEYSYTIERETYNLRNWYFQGRIPVRYSEYQLKIPQIFRFSVQSMGADSIEDKQEVVNELISGNEGVIETKSLKSSYKMRNLPGIKDEPFMGSAKDYMQRLEFQMIQIVYPDKRVIDLSVKWKDVIKNRLNTDEGFGKQLGKKVLNAKLFVEEAKQIIDTISRMRFIYKYLQKSMNWNGDEDNVYTESGIVRTWETRTGNVADINLLLINLLNEADIAAVPVLLSTRDHGLTIPTYTNITQFNTVMAYVAIGDKTFVLDATDKAISYILIPAKIANTAGFILEGKTGRWKDMLSGKSTCKLIAAVQAEIDEAGNMKGTGLVNCYDYARVQRVREYAEDKQKFKDEFFLNPYQGFKIDDIIVNNTEADSLPFEQKIKFTNQLNSSGEYRYFSMNLFAGLESNPFIAEKRISDVDFGISQEYILFGNYSIPPGFVFDGVPENIMMITPANDIVFNRITNVEANLLNVKMTVEFKNTFYTADSYPDFREFYKKLMDKLNEQVVIKKK
jgi:Domain of Unknown Function with PDB structure (DUF3857)